MKEEDTDVRPLLSRRETLVLIGAAGAGWLVGRWPNNVQAGPGTPSSLCIVRPEQTEGPYFVDEQLHRSDIRIDPTNGHMKPGTPLALTLHVMRLSAGDCRPLPDAQVDIWQCDAQGVYSDVRDPDFNTVGQKFLRGHQMTDGQGEARFLTIYPGWYPIRTVHIHFKIRTAALAKKTFEFTSQLYFPDEFTDHALANPPYASNGARRIRNRQDFIFRQGGEQLMLNPSATDSGYSSTFAIALTLP